MIATTYDLPFTAEIPRENPWNGRDPVDLTLQGTMPFDERQLEQLHARLNPFWSLGSKGGFAGTAVAPWLSYCVTPEIIVHKGLGLLRFQPCSMDIRATLSMVCLLLVLHEEFPLERASLSVPGITRRQISFNPEIVDPYPELWADLPFPVEIQDSESETRILRAQFTGPLTEDQICSIHSDLMCWGGTVSAGAYGVAPVAPQDCGCLPLNPVEHYAGEIAWAVEKCRFHYAALRALVSVCATIDQRRATIAGLTIE
jgi:hypothetical protein